MKISTVLYAVFYKESIKTRYVMAGLLLANFFIMLWNYLVTRRLFIQDHSEVVWYRTIDLRQIPYEGLVFVPLISALIFCAIQFIQETRDGRIRISLHTPCDSAVVVLLHAVYGLCFLFLLFALDAALLFITMIKYYPVEVASSALITALPWFLAGFYAYLGGAFVLLEPQLKRKILAAIVCFGLTVPLFIYRTVGFYQDIWPLFALTIPVMLYSIALSADDYRNRWVA